MIRWTTAFVDRPGASFDAARTFWQRVTATTLSPTRGRHGEFSTFVPVGADACLRLQRVDRGPGGTHIDLHVDDVRSGADRAIAAGATEVDVDSGVIVLRSPGGLAFCVVTHHGEATPPGPIGRPGARTIVDQVCIDVAPDRFDVECEFWRSLTGWRLGDCRESDYRVLTRPPSMPLRFLLQRRGDGDRGLPAGSHLDLSCDDVDLAARVHEALGATVLDRFPWWTVMADPSGRPYCLTARSPDTGLPASL